MRRNLTVTVTLLPKKRVRIDAPREVVEVLHTILDNVGGNPNRKSPRWWSDQLLAALEEAKIKLRGEKIGGGFYFA